MSRTLQEQFDARYTPEPMSGCWLWTLRVNKDGYGRFGVGCRGRSTLAHRVSWALRIGPIPEGSSVLHRCDVPSCVNPGHLFLGTHDDNMADMASKGRASRGTKHPNNKLTEAQVLEIRKCYSTGAWTQRGIATKFGVSLYLTNRIINRQLWKHV